MPDIFISYKKEDVARAEPIARLLAESGYEVWWDHRIPPGRSYREIIGAALQQAKCVVVLWSELSASAQWVLDEADEGKRRNVLLPVMIDAVDIPYGFRQIEAASLVGWTGDVSSPAWQSFIEGVTHFVGRPPGGAPKPFVTPSAAAQPAAAAAQVRPASPPTKSGGGAGILITAAAAVVVLGGGGYFAWQSGMFDGTERAAEADPVEAPVTGPAVPDPAVEAEPVETAEAPAPVTPEAPAPVETAAPTPVEKPAPVSRDPQPVKTAQTVVQVNFDGGFFRSEAGGGWVESSGIRWVEVSRDADTILLKDDSRNAQARFELSEGWIYLYFPDWGEFKRQWPIGSTMHGQ